MGTRTFALENAPLCAARRDAARVLAPVLKPGQRLEEEMRRLGMRLRVGQEKAYYTTHLSSPAFYVLRGCVDRGRRRGGCAMFSATREDEICER